jgi:hypothetical protein
VNDGCATAILIAFAALGLWMVMCGALVILWNSVMVPLFGLPRIDLSAASGMIGIGWLIFGGPFRLTYHVGGKQ